MNKHVHTILAIDDDIDDLYILHDALKAIDSEVSLLTAQNGLQGLQKLEGLKEEGALPCLIVLDVNMPVLDGRQTYEALRSNSALQDIPVVVFSTSTSPADKSHFEGFGTEYITKPVQFNQLLQVAQRFLGYCKK